MKLKIMLYSIVFLSTISFAQTKVGTVNSNYIVNLMPESAIAFKRTENYALKLDSTFSVKISEYRKKLDDFKKNENTLGILAKKTATEEITALETDVKNYQQNAQKLIQLKQEELMRPLYKKLSNAIQEVAKAEEFTQILTTSGNEIAYIDSKFDITELVIKKLGIAKAE